MLSSLKKQFEKTQKNLDIPILKTGAALAEKIIGIKLSNEKEMLKILKVQIKNLLSEIVDQQEIILHIHPDCLELVEKSNLLKDSEHVKIDNITLKGDDQLIPGECSLETEDFFINGKISSQIINLYTELTR